MKLLTNASKYYAGSLLFHVIVLTALALVSFHSRTSIPTFQASVVFSPPASEIKKTTKSTEQAENITVSKPQKQTKEVKSESTTPPPVPKKIKAPKLKENAAPTGVNASDLVQQPSIKRSELEGFLRASKRTKNAPSPDIQTQTTASKEQSADAPLFPEHKYPKSNNAQTKTSNKQSGPLSVWRKKNELQSFRNTIKQYIVHNWTNPISRDIQFEIKIEFAFDRRGNLIDMRLIKRSGIAIVDSSAERAIRVSTPYPKFPDFFDPDEEEYRATIRFTPDNIIF